MTSVLRQTFYGVVLSPNRQKCCFYIMLIFQLSMLTLMSISMGNLELPLLLEPILNGFHFILLQYHCQKRIGRFPQHIKRGNIFCSPFLQKDDLDKFVHILFLAITAQHNTSYFNYLSNKLAMQLYHFNFSFFFSLT